MAKQKHEESTSNTNAIIVMVLGFLLVGGLVVWALTRTVEVAPPATVNAPVAETTAPIALETAARNTPPIPMTPPPQATSTMPAEHEDSEEKRAVPRIAAEDLQAKVSRGEVTIIDVRDPKSFDSGHIPGALNMQFTTIEGQIDLIPKNKPIVLYCT